MRLGIGPGLVPTGGGRVDPGFRRAGRSGTPAPDPRDEAVARWALLYADPFAELELFALTGAGAVPSSGFVPGPRARGDLLLDGVSGLDARDTVRGAWADAGLGELLTEAATAVRGAPPSGGRSWWTVTRRVRCPG